MSPEERAARVAAAKDGPFGQSKAVSDLLLELARVTAERDGRLEQALSDVRQITRERDEARHVMLASWEDAKARYMPERDTAIARAEKAEDERDAALAQVQMLRKALRRFDPGAEGCYCEGICVACDSQRDAALTPYAGKEPKP